jgi:hypothetical protein
MQEAISILVLWGIVPGIMLGVLFFNIIIVARTPQDERKISARAGFWAGLVLFVVYVISQLDTLREPAFTFGLLPRFSILAALDGFVIGFMFLWGVRFLVPTRMVGLISLILSATSTSALYSYVFIESLRGTVLFLSLGVAFGALLHIVFFPASIRAIWD